MKKAAYIVIISLMGLLFAVDLLIVALGAGHVEDLVSPVGALASAAVLFAVYIKTRRYHPVNVAWLLFALACLSRMAADAVWAFEKLEPGTHPVSDSAIQWAYLLPDLLLFTAATVFVIAQFKAWNGARLLLDAAMFAICAAALIWIVMLGRNSAAVEITWKSGAASAIGIFTDILTICALSIWYLSARSGYIPMFIGMAVSAMVLYSLTDLAYYYINYYGFFKLDSFIDAAYTGSLMLLGVSALTERYTKKGGTINTQNGYGEGGHLKKHVKALVVLALPVLAMSVKGFVLAEVLAYGVVLVVYKGLAVYFEASRRNDELLKREIEINNELETMVAEKTKDLVDVNGSLSRRNEQLAYLSCRDMLTGLFNRRYLLDWLEEHVGGKSAEPVALLYMDLDRFKVINDTHGHEMGDRVLVEIAARLSAFQYHGAILARMGGDEFVLAFTGTGGEPAATRLAERIIVHCGRNIYTGDYVFSPTMCIGISLCPQDADNAASLLKHADIALYHAKQTGPGRCAAFNLMIQQKTQRRNALEMLLGREETMAEFSLHYQPQFSIPDNRLIGAEALLRWRNIELGTVSPVEFIPIAEETGRINAIGLWVLKTATAQAAEWNTLYGGGLVVGVNISPRQLNSTALLQELKSFADRKDFNAQWLDIEITESGALEGEYRLVQIFRMFKSIGMSVSIDDFGAGYSSLMSLKRYSFDRIKIAKPMIDSLLVSERDEQIVSALILLSKSIGMTTIAEGVETQEQYLKLVALGCDQIQGYYMGRPVPVEEFEARYLKTGYMEDFAPA